jgi:ketosteroid isomerase-like protein
MNKALVRFAPWAVLLVSGLLACTKAPAAQEPDRVALEAAVHRWVTAVNSQDVDALNATMTEDVELLDANGATVAGRDAAIRALREVATRGKLGATSREITISNDVAWHAVGFVQTQKNGVVHARGQALEIWKRVKGQWKLHRQIAAGVITPADSLTRPSPNEPVLDRPQN